MYVVLWSDVIIYIYVCYEDNKHKYFAINYKYATSHFLRLFLVGQT